MTCQYRFFPLDIYKKISILYGFSASDVISAGFWTAKNLTFPVMYVGFGHIVFQLSALKKAATFFSGTLVPIYETIQFHTAEKSVLNTQREKLKNH